MKLDIQQLTNLVNGLICEGAVGESQMPLNTVSESINLHFDKIGAAQLRPGETLLGNQISAGTDILGLYEFRDSGSGSNNQIIAVNGTVVYYLNNDTWTSKRESLTSGSKARFTTFLDYVFMVNGTESTAIWNGSSDYNFVSTGNASGAPTGKYIDNFRSRIWIAGNSSYPDRLYFSSLPSAVATPVITWDTNVATGDWIDISPSDGENITGLQRDKSALLVFKNNHIYRVYSIGETEPDPKINIGTYSQESIVPASNGVYFHHPTGIYRYSGGAVGCISQPIQDFIDNVSLSAYEDVCGWCDGNHIYHSLGDITIGDITYTNVVSRYTISSEVWTIYSYATKPLVSSNYNDGSTLYYLTGDDDGNVLKMNTGTTDNGSPIMFSLISRPYTLDGLFSTRKSISKMSAIHQGAQGALLSYRVDDDNVNKWNPIGQIEKSGKPITVSIKGNKIYFRLYGSSVGEHFVWTGLEVLESQSELIG